MDAATFLGMTVGAIVSLIVLIKPICNLTSSITELNVTLKETRKDAEEQRERVTKHGKEIDAMHDAVVKHDVIIEDHEKRLSKLEN